MDDFPTPSAEAHWQDVHSRREPEQVTWYERVPESSLALIAEADLGPDAAILDAGGGASTVARHLLDAGYTDLTVADISSRALERARAQLGDRASEVKWIQADLRSHDFGRRYDLWHDRAAFHFMVDPADRAGYLAVLSRTLRPGGHLVLATFGPEGPKRCSGLPVSRYDPETLAHTLGPDYRLVSSRLTEHRTPRGEMQQFLHTHFVRGQRESATRAASS